MTGVRAAGAGDVDELARLRAQWRGEDLTPEFVTAFRAWFGREERWWWVAGGERAVGMVNVKLFERMPSPDLPRTRWGYLANLYVEPTSRGAGAGAALVQAAIDRARAEGLVRVVLSPSQRSVPLYRRLGFRDADELLLHPLD